MSKQDSNGPGSSSPGSSGSPGNSPDSERPSDPLDALRKEFQRKYKAERLTEVRACRVKLKEAARIDHMANELDLDVSTFMRLVINGELSAGEDRPDMVLALAVMDQARQLVRDFEVEAQSRGCASEASILREEIESLFQGFL